MIEQKSEPEKQPDIETVLKAPEQGRKPLSVRPPESREIKRPPSEQAKKPQTPSEAPGPMPGGRKEMPRRAELKITKDTGGAVLPPAPQPLPSRAEKSGRQPEAAEKPRKKGGKPPVEVQIGEAAPPRKKAL